MPILRQGQLKVAYCYYYSMQQMILALQLPIWLKLMMNLSCLQLVQVEGRKFWPEKLYQLQDYSSGEAQLYLSVKLCWKKKQLLYYLLFHYFVEELQQVEGYCWILLHLYLDLFQKQMYLQHLQQNLMQYSWFLMQLVQQCYYWRFYPKLLYFFLLLPEANGAEQPSYNLKYKLQTSLPPLLTIPISQFFIDGHNNFIMAQNFNPEKRVNDIEKKMLGQALLKSQEQKKRQIFDYDNQQFMMPMPDPTNNVPQKGPSPAPQIKKSMVLNKTEVERSLTEIYNYYTRAYIQPTKECSQFDAIKPPKLDIKGFLLFAKNFRILKTIFSLDRMILIFKKHADFGKYLSFDNFYFMINSLSHEQEVKTYFNLDSMLQNLDIETIEELEKQEFYNYLQIKDPQTYRKNFTELFGSFNIKEKPRTSPLKYNYRKFSLPQLRKKALLQPKQKKKGEKDLFILKHDKQMHQNVFDEAKSIVVSWDSLRAKSVNNLGKPSDLVQKKYLKIDPEEDPYLQEVRPASKPSPKNGNNRADRSRDNKQQRQRNKIDKKIKEIQQTQNLKNQQILNRIEKKLKLPSSHKLQI